MRPPRLLSSVEAEQDLQELGGVPIDRMTWRVVSKGERYVPDVQLGNQLLFDAMPPPRSMKRARHETPPQDMRGRKCGIMNVVAYWGPRIDKGGRYMGGADNQRWVCRCPCGLYVIRTADTIKKARDANDKCVHCRHLDYLKRNEVHRRYEAMLRPVDQQSGDKSVD